MEILKEREGLKDLSINGRGIIECGVRAYWVKENSVPMVGSSYLVEHRICLNP